MIEENDGIEGFYAEVAELLSAEHTYEKFPFRKRTRWNNRHAGNGRYVGCGIVRLFGPKVHMALRHPIQINRWFETKALALAYLRTELG